MSTQKKTDADKERAQAVKKLIKLGDDQGFVTQEQVLEIFIYPEKYLEELDDLYDQLFAKGIDVFESVVDSTGSEMDSEQTELEKELELLSTLSDSSINDPVRMYLKEIRGESH